MQRLRPSSAADWLLIAGDTGEFLADIEWALGTLSQRFERVIWVPGNHDLWTHARDPVRLRGEQRYQRLVEVCRGLGVLTPEDPFCVWAGAGVAQPSSCRCSCCMTTRSARTGHGPRRRRWPSAYDSGVVCTDERFLYPDPYPSREAWCQARIELTERRLASLDPGLPTVLVNHFPLVREPTRVLRYPEFAQWCGTTRTAGWHLRYRAAAVVYGHLHIPRTTWYDGVPFLEVSLGYPREWRRRGAVTIPRQVLPLAPV